LIACHISFTLFRCHAIAIIAFIDAAIFFHDYFFQRRFSFRYAPPRHTPIAGYYAALFRHYAIIIPPCRHADAAFADAAAIFSFSIFRHILPLAFSLPPSPIFRFSPLRH
jgi:hypothetical protein